jgi:RNA-directed DNA polymerase
VRRHGHLRARCAIRHPPGHPQSRQIDHDFFRKPQKIASCHRGPEIDPVGTTCEKCGLKECGLDLHPEKTKIVYCKDDDRRRTYPNEKFDFLGCNFRPRRSKNRKGKYFINFSPAVSDKAVKSIREEIRSWNLHFAQ